LGIARGGHSEATRSNEPAGFGAFTRNFKHQNSGTDQDGDVLDILVQSRRDQKAAKKFFRKLLKGLRYVPRVIITDKLKRYHAAKQELMPSVEHRQDKGQNNRAETPQDCCFAHL
jgi:hypothetical protein